MNKFYVPDNSDDPYIYNIETQEPGISIENMKYQVCMGVTFGNFVLKSPPLTKYWFENQLTWEDVRQIYRRAVWVHCPNKPMLLVQWAEFEIDQGKYSKFHLICSTFGGLRV